MENANYWEKILLSDLPIEFLLEVILRTVIMFIIILITLRASGKRGIKQLSIFELVLIIGLGSAAGDPMFYEDVGLLPAFMVFIVVILLYIGITKLADRYTAIEKLLEGKPIYIIRDGELLIEHLKDSGLSQDEFFSELRLRSIEHLGQVRTVLIETSGEFSVLFYEDSEVQAGLPIFPDKLAKKLNHVSLSGLLACCNCGYVADFDQHKASQCPTCSCNEWVESMDKKRIA